MSDQMPIVFLPSGISRIIPHSLDSKDDQIADTYYNHGYALKDRSASRSEKVNESTTSNGMSSDTEMADESGDFLPEMTIDDEDQLSDDNDQKTKGISPTPSNSGAGANAKTLKVYQSHVRVFKDWLKLEGLPTDFEYCSAEELSSWLKKFYRDGKRKDGQQWKPSSLKIFRFAINQHLNSEPFNRSISITKDQQFKEANNVIKERQKELIQLGEDATGTRESRESARPMTADDVRQLYQRNIVGVNSPKALHRYVFMILGINFGITTRLALHLLRPSMLEFKVDENSGLTYVLYDPKRDKTGLNKALLKPKRKMYGVSGNPLCPINALKLYIQKRNPECTEAFFHTPNRHYKETGVWYTPQATGKNTLGRLMKDIAAEGKLSFPYTNHSLRYTPPYIFSPPDPRTNAYRINENKIVSINGDGSSNGKPSYIDTSSYNLLNIKPKGCMESERRVFSSGVPYKSIVERPAITNITTSERIPLLYPPISSSAVPVSMDTSSDSHVVQVLTETPKGVKQPVIESRPKPHSTSTTRPIKAHHVLCVSKQWQIEDILKAINSGDAIILSKQGVLETAPENHETRHHVETQNDLTEPTRANPVVVNNEAGHNDIKFSKTSESQKLSARPGRKQLEPKRIRPDEEDSFQVEVAYDDAVTSIQANLTLIKQLQKNYPLTKQTIDELFKVRKMLDRLLTEL